MYMEGQVEERQVGGPAAACSHFVEHFLIQQNYVMHFWGIFYNSLVCFDMFWHLLRGVEAEVASLLVAIWLTFPSTGANQSKFIILANWRRKIFMLSVWLLKNLIKKNTAL